MERDETGRHAADLRAGSHRQVVLRHAESEWNLKNLPAGWVTPGARLKVPSYEGIGLATDGIVSRTGPVAVPGGWGGEDNVPQG